MVGAFGAYPRFAQPRRFADALPALDSFNADHRAQHPEIEQVEIEVGHRLHGSIITRWYWLCPAPACRSRRRKLYVVQGAIGCRRCCRLHHRCRHRLIGTPLGRLDRLRRRLAATPADDPRRRRLVRQMIDAHRAALAEFREIADVLDRGFKRRVERWARSSN
jgi:hypothetical protein